MCLLIEIRHNFLIQCHRNYIEVEKLKIIYLKLTFSEITLKNYWVSLGVIFEGFGCSNDALLAKTMLDTCQFLNAMS